jgi:hypothetical protein
METAHPCRLTLEQDGIWQSDNVALLDFEDATGLWAVQRAAVHTRGAV